MTKTVATTPNANAWDRIATEHQEAVTTGFPTWDSLAADYIAATSDERRAEVYEGMVELASHTVDHEDGDYLHQVEEFMANRGLGPVEQDALKEIAAQDD